MDLQARRKSRRKLLRLAVTGAGAALGVARAQRSQTGRINIGDRGPQMIGRATALGREYEAKYGNCAQCTIAALQDSIEFIPKEEQIFLAGSSLSGGATANGNANCGGFTGAGIVIGQLCGRSRANFSNRSANQLAGKLMGEVAGKYEQVYGSVLCKDVREKAGKDCPEVVARAAGWAAESILKQLTNYGAPQS